MELHCCSLETCASVSLRLNAGSTISTHRTNVQRIRTFCKHIIRFWKLNKHSCYHHVNFTFRTMRVGFMRCITTWKDGVLGSFSQYVHLFQGLSTGMWMRNEYFCLILPILSRTEASPSSSNSSKGRMITANDLLKKKIIKNESLDRLAVPNPIKLPRSPWPVKTFLKVLILVRNSFLIWPLMLAQEIIFVHAFMADQL